MHKNEYHRIGGDALSYTKICQELRDMSLVNFAGITDSAMRCRKQGRSGKSGDHRRMNWGAQGVRAPHFS